MTSLPISSAALRGAVDLSSLGQPAPTSPAGGSGGLLVEGTDAGFQDIVLGSRDVPAVVVLWSGRLPASRDFVDVVVGVATGYAGKFRVVSVDVDANPVVRQAFQVESVPVGMGLIAGQPVPLFAGAQPPETVRAYVDELLTAAAQYGVTGSVDVGGAVEADLEPELSPLHVAAFEAIERDDLDAAIAAFEQALTESPSDADARLGLAQVKLMKRTAGADPVQARAAAVAAQTDVAAQTLVADLDVLEGHVEEAFVRLVDTVRATAGDERNAAREHLLQLFEIVGAQDERVVKARRALMSALF